MNKIINLGNGVDFGSEKDRQEFSVKFKRGGIDFAMYGDIKIIIQMLYQAMESQAPAVAQTLITTVLIFADKKGIPLHELKKHSFITTDGGIITP